MGGGGVGGCGGSLAQAVGRTGRNRMGVETMWVSNDHAVTAIAIIQKPLCLFLSLSFSLSLSVSVSLSMSLCLSLSVCLSVCLPVSLEQFSVPVILCDCFKVCTTLSPEGAE